jgi:hypothetical protein
VVGRRWSQAGGGAPRAPNNGGAAAVFGDGGVARAGQASPVAFIGD